MWQWDHMAWKGPWEMIGDSNVHLATQPMDILRQLEMIMQYKEEEDGTKRDKVIIGPEEKNKTSYT